MPTISPGRADRRAARALKRCDPHTDVRGSVGSGQVLPDELLSVAELALDLTPRQRSELAREEAAAIADTGVRFESMLTAGLSFEIVRRRDLRDPRVTHLVHDLDETRYTRSFARMMGQLAPRARHPLDRTFARAAQSIVLTRLLRRPATLCVLVLAGEEITDRFRTLASEHPATDPFVRAVNESHRRTTPSRRDFARAWLPELWRHASRVDRFLARNVAPRVAHGMFAMLVHPGVYEVVGLPAWPTWRRVNATESRRQLRRQALRSVAHALAEAGAFNADRLPGPWRAACGVDHASQLLAAS